MFLLAWDNPFSFERPAWLWLLLLVPVLAIVSVRSLAGLDPVRRVLAIVVRSLVVIVVALSLAEVVRVRVNRNLTVMFLMDRSKSVRGLEGAEEQYIKKIGEKCPPNDRVGMVEFARDTYVGQMPMHGGYFPELGRLPEMKNADRTDVAGAIRMALALFPHDSAKRIVLLTDGNDNMGDVLGQAAIAKADGVTIDVAPLKYLIQNEVYFDKMMAPSSAEEGEQVPIRMVLNSRKPASGTIDLYHNGKRVELPADRAHVRLGPGMNTFFLKLPIHESGPQRFEALFTPDDPKMDEIVDNNRATAFSFVSGKSKALLLTTHPEHDGLLVDALRSENVNVEVRDAAEASIDSLELLKYSTVILANVPANLFTDEQQKSLAQYVRDLGGGLIMTGGDEGFGAGGWIGSPVAEVMPVSFEIKHKRVIPRGALVIIMHSCEIPRGNYWGKEMAKKSVDTISSRDYIGVLAFTYSPVGYNWEVPLTLATNKAAIKSVIDKMQNGDMPDFDTTMDLAIKGLRGTDASQKHVIIISDGDPAPPSEATLRKYIDDKVTCSTIGIGWGMHVMTQTLQGIANRTGGRFYAPKSAEALPQIFIKESKVVHRPLIVDEPFQPQWHHRHGELLAGVTSSEIPKLGGLVLTSPKEDPRVIMPLIRATEDGNDPVLAYWQEGLGKSVAFTSGFWPYWGANWTNWPGFAKLWAQIVRWSMRQDAPANFETITTVDGNRGRIVIEALDKDASYLNFLTLGSTVIQPDQSVAPVTFTQTGPGRYEGTFEVDQTGQYIANVAISEAGQSRGSIHTGVSVPFSPEFRELNTNEPLLQQIVDITGGRRIDDLDTTAADVFSHDLPPTVSKQPAWDWAVAWLLLPLFLLDVAVRRLASWVALSICVEVVLLAFLLFGLDIIHTTKLGVLGAFVLAELVGWSIRFRSIPVLIDFLTHTVTTLAPSAQRSTVALEQLKGKREQVRGERTGAGAETTEAAQHPAVVSPPPDARRRFEIDERKAKVPAGDLQEELGGAKTAAPPVEKLRAPAPAKASEPQTPAEVTARLLEARRRARQSIDRKDE
ncbi:MAG TPA: VWA domain-containing protein [Phycisphaerae bacterium]